MSKADISDNGTPFILYGELYTTYNEVTYTVHRRTKCSVDNECYSKVGDVIIPTSGETPEEIATSTCVMIPNVILAGDLNIYRNTKIDGRFLSYIINHIVNNEIARTAQGKSIVHIKANELAKISVRYPSSLEQSKILSLFELLDKRIDKQKAYIEILKSYKRGLLSSFFEQKFCPPLSAKWHTMRLGDVFAERSERASGNELLLAVTINNGVIKRSDIELKNNSSEDKSNYKKVRIGDIAYNTMRMWQGASGTSLFDGIVSPAYTIVYLRNANENNIGFWAYYFKHIPLIQAFQKSSQGLTSDTWNLKYPQFAQIQVYVPSYAEQCRIYRILTAYDNCILANENLSNSLEKYKYTLLSQMFI